MKEPKSLPSADCISIGFDHSKESDVTTLVVATHYGEKIKVIKTLYDKEAELFYRMLTETKDKANSKSEQSDDRCECGGTPLEQAGLEAGVNTSVYRIECSSCKKRTLWLDKEKCAWCEWKEIQNE